MCADGAPSRIGTQLGLITRPPDSTCSRSYVEGGTHKFKADGVVFYTKDMLPGLVSLIMLATDMLLTWRPDELIALVLNHVLYPCPLCI